MFQPRILEYHLLSSFPLVTGSLDVFPISREVSECPPVPRESFVVFHSPFLSATKLFYELSLLVAPKFLAKSAGLFHQDFHDARGASP